MYTRYLFSKAFQWFALFVLFLNTMGCAGTTNGRSEDPLVQLQNQIAALRREVNQSLRRTESERESILQNRANYLADSEEMKSKLQVIESKLSEYSEQMVQLSEKIDTLQARVNEELEARQAATFGPSPYISPTPTGPLQPFLTEDMAPAVPPSSFPPLSSPSTTSEELQTPPPSQVTGTTPITPPPLSPPVVSPPTGTSEDLTAPGRIYRTAYDEYLRGNYDVAIAGFQKYLEFYPNEELADLAQYWIAESFSNLHEYETALKEYDKLINLYPGSKRLPWAYYNKAGIFLRLGKQLEATSHLRYVLNRFPTSEVAEKAQQDLAKLGQ